MNKKIYLMRSSVGEEYHTWRGQNCFLHSAGGIKIGKAVGIGPMVKILTSGHKEDEPSKPILFRDLEFGEVIIEDGCDIGIGSIILPGVKIKRINRWSRSSCNKIRPSLFSCGWKSCKDFKKKTR